MFSKKWRLHFQITRHDGCLIKDLTKSAQASRDVPFTIFSNSRLPIRKDLHQNILKHSTNDLSICHMNSLNSKNKMTSNLSSKIYQKNIFSKIKTILSKHDENRVQKNNHDFSKRIELPLIAADYLTNQSSIRKPVCGCKIRKSNQVVKNLLRECRRIRKTLNTKNKDFSEIQQIDCPKIEVSSIVTTPVPLRRSKFLFTVNDTDQDKEDTLYGLEDNTESISETVSTIAQPSLTSISLYLTASDDSKSQKQSYSELNKTFVKTNSTTLLTNYQVKPAYISVFEIYFPKLHILHFNSSDARSKPTKTIVRQDNNNNSTDNSVNAHKYFRHAQQLISNNSSQMQSIVYGAEKNPQIITSNPVIKPFRGGKVTETREDISYLQNKLKHDITSEENNSLPFDQVIDHNMGKDETAMIMNHNEDRKSQHLGPALAGFQERKQRQRIEAQANDYKNMSSNFRQLKVDCETYEKVNRKVMNSPEIVKNVQRNEYENRTYKPIESLPMKNDMEENSDYSESTQNVSSERCLFKERSESHSNLKNKKVCFNIDLKKTDKVKQIEPGTPYMNTMDFDKSLYLDQQIQGINMMLNNVIRRMNNLELHFQEFSTLFINLHKESLYTQKNMTLANQCFDFNQLDCNQEIFS